MSREPRMERRHTGSASRTGLRTQTLRKVMAGSRGMRRVARLLVCLAMLGAAGSPAPAGAGASARAAYPPTRVDDVVEHLHGTTVHDPYRWLEDGTSAEVQGWARDQNAFARR